MVTELASIIGTLSSAIGCNIGTFIEMAKGIYCISSGGVTQENISRWTGKKGSYRSLQRLVQKSINWLNLNVLLLQNHWLEDGGEQRYVLAVDEVVAKKAGKKTFGVNWFYSSIAGKAIRSISFHAISVVDTKRARSFALHQIQNVKGAAGDKVYKKEVAAKAKKKHKKRTGDGKADKNAVPKKPVGRPKGCKNKQKVQEKSALSEGLKTLLDAVLPQLSAIGLAIKYALCDGAYGNKTCMMIARKAGLHLISKLNRKTVLYLPYAGAYAGRGAPKKFGEQLRYDKLPAQNLKNTETQKGIKTQIYQFQKVWSRNSPCLMNVVIIQKTNRETQQTAQVILFCTDLELDWEKMIYLYAMRFQIEFNFRDAKQYFGLADLKNVKEQSVKNAVGMAFFMGNLSLILLEKAKLKFQVDECSVQDLKAMFRADFYLQNILNTLDMPNKPLFNDPIFQNISYIGAVNLKKKAA